MVYGSRGSGLVHILTGENSRGDSIMHTAGCYEEGGGICSPAWSLVLHLRREAVWRKETDLCCTLLLCCVLCKLSWRKYGHGMVHRLVKQFRSRGERWGGEEEGAAV